MFTKTTLYKKEAKSQLFLTCVVLLLCLPQASFAQEPYVPPPLFGEPKLPPPRDPEVRKNVPKMPPISKPVIAEEPREIPREAPSVKSQSVEPFNKPAKIERKVTIEKVPQEEKAPAQAKQAPFVQKTTPKPAVKPKAPTASKEPRIKIEKAVAEEAYATEKQIDVIPGPEPIDLLNEIEGDVREAEKVPAQAIEIQKVQSETGNIKGSKSMPSVKKQAVESEVLFEGDDEKPHLMERLKNQITKPKKSEQVEEAEVIDAIEQEEEKNQAEIIDLSLPTISDKAADDALSEFETLADGRKKIVLTYDDKQMDLSQAHKDVINQVILPALDANGEALLKIQAFAAPQDGSLSADRRIALSRALAIREYLVEQEIISPRIDVRSMGAQTDITPLDRVELYLIE